MHLKLEAEIDEVAQNFSLENMKLPRCLDFNTFEELFDILAKSSNKQYWQLLRKRISLHEAAENSLYIACEACVYFLESLPFCKVKENKYCFFIAHEEDTGTDVCIKSEKIRMLKSDDHYYVYEKPNFGANFQFLEEIRDI
jgi:hypothetical protein